MSQKASLVGYDIGVSKNPGLEVPPAASKLMEIVLNETSQQKRKETGSKFKKRQTNERT
jgi:hypothetical protein